MKVKLLISRAGADFVENVGDEIVVSNEEGLRMIEAGQAVLIQEVEKANSKKVTQKAAK
jgi:hypothetical protein